MVPRQFPDFCNPGRQAAQAAASAEHASQVEADKAANTEARQVDIEPAEIAVKPSDEEGDAFITSDAAVEVVNKNDVTVRD